MDELRRVIAHGHGQYTEPVAEFFRELNKTAIPDALVQRALAAAPTEPLFAAFNKIYEACKPLPFESRALFDALSTVIALRIQDSVRDRALLDVIRAQHTELSKQITEIAQSLARSIRRETTCVEC